MMQPGREPGGGAGERRGPQAGDLLRRIPRSRWLATVGLAAVLAVPVACGGDGDEAASTVDPIAAGTDDTPTPMETTTTSSSDAGTSPVPPTGRVDAFQAVSIAAREGPGTVVDLDSDDGRWELDVRLEDGSGVEVEIDADTGEVVDRSDESVPPAPPVGIEAAMSSAMEAAPGGHVTEADLDDDDGRPIWEIVIDSASGDDVEVHVDATTGEVLPLEDDGPDDD